MNLRKSTGVIVAVAACALAVVSAKPAQASLAPTNPIVTGGGGVFTFTYGTVLSAGETGDRQDFLEISGIHGYIPGSAFSSPSFTPVVVTVGGVTHIAWRENGDLTGPLPLNFGFNATTDALGDGRYSYKIDGTGGTETHGTGTVQVPMTPEPATLVTMGLFVAVLMGLVLNKRSRGVNHTSAGAIA